MNELSVAESIIDIAQRNARGRRVAKVEVRVGDLRQVAPESLDFAFNLLARGTALEGAELVVWYVSAAGRCRHCGAAQHAGVLPAELRAVWRTRSGSVRG